MLSTEYRNNDLTSALESSSQSRGRSHSSALHNRLKELLQDREDFLYIRERRSPPNFYTPPAERTTERARIQRNNTMEVPSAISTHASLPRKQLPTEPSDDLLDQLQSLPPELNETLETTQMTSYSLTPIKPEEVELPTKLDPPGCAGDSTNTRVSRRALLIKRLEEIQHGPLNIPVQGPRKSAAELRARLDAILLDQDDSSLNECTTTSVSVGRKSATSVRQRLEQLDKAE